MLLAISIRVTLSKLLVFSISSTIRSERFFPFLGLAADFSPPYARQRERYVASPSSSRCIWS